MKFLHKVLRLRRAGLRFAFARHAPPPRGFSVTVPPPRDRTDAPVARPTALDVQQPGQHPVPRSPRMALPHAAALADDLPRRRGALA
jgi:hypothetical protein